jgi:O-antigen ligase
MIQKFSRYFFFGCILLLPLQTVWLWRESFLDGVKWQYGTIGLYGTDILLLIAFLGVLLGIVRGGASRHRQTTPDTASSPNGEETNKPSLSFLLWLLLCLVVFVAMCSLFWAEDKWLAGYFLIKIFLAGGVFWFVRSMHIFDTTQKAVRWLWGGVMVIAVLESLLGIVQFLMQVSFASKWLGMSDYVAWQSGVSVLKNESGRWLRAYGTFPHPNILGVYLGVVLMGVIGWYVLQRGRVSVWLVGVIPLLFVGLLVSFSRGAWLGVGLSFFVLSVGVLRSSDEVYRRRWLESVLLIAVTTLIFTSLLSETIFPRFDGTTIQAEGSVIDRAVLMYQASEIIHAHPWLGVGAGNYTLAVMRLHPEIPVWDVQPVHNVFVLVYAELGIIGGLAFGMFFLGVLMRIFGIFSRGEWSTQKAIASIAFLGLIPSLFLDHFLWDSHFGLLFLALVLGSLVAKDTGINT